MPDELAPAPAAPVGAADPDQAAQPRAEEPTVALTTAELSSLVAEAARDDPDCDQAAKFADTFRPLEGVDYGWALRRAKRQYVLATSWHERADKKAGAIITYVGSIMGLLALGSGAAVAGGQLSPWVALAGLPSFMLAALATICAARAREPIAVMVPPTGREAALRTTFYLDPVKAEVRSWPTGTWPPR